MAGWGRLPVQQLWKEEAASEGTNGKQHNSTGWKQGLGPGPAQLLDPHPLGTSGPGRWRGWHMAGPATASAQLVDR